MPLGQDAGRLAVEESPVVAVLGVQAFDLLEDGVGAGRIESSERSDAGRDAGAHRVRVLRGVRYRPRSDRAGFSRRAACDGFDDGGEGLPPDANDVFDVVERRQQTPAGFAVEPRAVPAALGNVVQHRGGRARAVEQLRFLGRHDTLADVERRCDPPAERRSARLAQRRA